MNKIVMHINYAEVVSSSFGNKSIDDICKIAADMGYEGIQFRGKVPKELAALSFREYAMQIGQSKKKYGLTEILFGINVTDCASEDKEAREKGIADAVENAKIASDLCGTTVCNTFGPRLFSKIETAPRTADFNGSAAATQMDWELTADAYSRVGYELGKIGMKFAFETHPHYINDTPEASRKLVDMIGSPNVGINIDYGNTVYFSNHPSLEETIDLYGDKIFFVHLKNSSPIPGTKARRPTALCDGEINHRIYLAKLKEIGYNGPIAIEAPRNGDRLHFAQQDLDYLKAIIADM